MHISSCFKTRLLIPSLIGLALILLNVNCSKGQPASIVNTEVYLGASIPVGGEFSHVHALGANVGANVLLSMSKKFSFGPCLIFQYHAKYINEGAKDMLLGTAVGLIAEYSIPIANTRFKFYPQGGILYQVLWDHIAARKGYRGETIKIMQANDIAFTLGGGLQFRSIRFTLRYIMFHPSVKFDEDLFSDLAQHNEYYTIFTNEERNKMNLSSLSLQLGYRF